MRRLQIWGAQSGAKNFYKISSLVSLVQNVLGRLILYYVTKNRLDTKQDFWHLFLWTQNNSKEFISFKGFGFDFLNLILVWYTDLSRFKVTA